MKLPTDPLGPQGSVAPEPTLAALLERTTRRLPDWVLATCAIGGLLTSAIILIFTPPWWRIVTVPALLSAFGTWGIGERERVTSGSRGLLFTAMRGVATIAAIAATVLLVLSFFGAALGTWIS